MTTFKRLLARAFLAFATLVVAQTPVALAFAQQAAPEAQPEQDDSESWSVIDDDWMVMEIGGSRVGWMNSRVEQSGEQFRTITVTDLAIERGVKVTIRIESTFVETADGKPVSMRSVQDMSRQRVDTRWMFKGDKVMQVVRQGSGTPKSEVRDLPKEPWLTPHAAEEYVKLQRKAGAKEITYTTLDPQNGVKPFSVTNTLEGEKEYEGAEGSTHVQVWSSVTSILAGVKGTEYYDPAEDEVVYQETPIAGLGNIVMRAASKAEAMREVAGGGGPDIMMRSFTKPDKPIEHSMSAVKTKLKITAREGTLPDLPSAGSQRVEMSDDRKSAVLTIDINNPQPASQEDQNNTEFTKPSTLIDFEDELVVKLSNGAKDTDDAMSKADALRRVANKRISKKEMSTVFACASETAKTQIGDCSEHGVLLAALLRAQGIPSRVAMGLVYVDAFMGEEGIFGWHMWTQALIDGRWVDLDATLPVRYNAAHVLTGTSPLADGLMAADMASIIQLIGNIDIQVLEVEHAND